MRYLALFSCLLQKAGAGGSVKRRKKQSSGHKHNIALIQKRIGNIGIGKGRRRSGIVQKASLARFVQAHHGNRCFHTIRGSNASDIGSVIGKRLFYKIPKHIVSHQAGDRHGKSEFGQIGYSVSCTTAHMRSNIFYGAKRSGRRNGGSVLNNNINCDAPDTKDLFHILKMTHTENPFPVFNVSLDFFVCCVFCYFPFSKRLSRRIPALGLSDNFGAKRHKGKLCQLKALLSEGNPDDRNAPQKAHHQCTKGKLPAKQKNPQKIQQKFSGFSAVTDFMAKRP